MNETILITGGTGLLGHALVDTLTRRGYKIIILTRNIQNNANSSQVSYASWDIKEQTIDVSALEKADHIIHLAGAAVIEKKWTARYKKEIVDSRVNGSKLLIKGLTRIQHHVKTLVSASAIGWYGEDKIPGKAFTEEDPPDDSFLGETCRVWEQSTLPAEAMGIRVCRLRIGILLSMDGGAMAEFIKPVKFGLATILGGGRQIVSWIHIDDVSRIFLKAIEDKEMNGSYNAVGPEPVTNKLLILNIAQKIKGRFFISLHVPALVLKIIMGQRSVEILKSTTVSDTKLKATGFTFLYPTLEAALNELIKKPS